jgi:hypothetical protein
LKTELHIFKGVESIFDLKYKNFINNHLGEVLIGGRGLKRDPITSFSLYFKPNHDVENLISILIEMLKQTPLIEIKSFNKYEELESSFKIFYLNSDELIEDFYCLEDAFDFVQDDYRVVQICEVKTKSLTLLNRFWLN